MTRGWRVLVLTGTVALMAIAGAGVRLVSGQLPMIAEGWQSRSWPSAPAVIEQSTAVAMRATPRASSSGGLGTHAVTVRYRFTVDGRTYEGRRRSLDLVGKRLIERNAMAFAARLPVGRTVPAYYDPRDPTRSLLDPGVPVSSMIGLAIGAVLASASLFVLLRYLLPELRRAWPGSRRRVPMPY
jgi:hypothetical protein